MHQDALRSESVETVVVCLQLQRRLLLCTDAHVVAVAREQVAAAWP